VALWFRYGICKAEGINFASGRGEQFIWVIPNHNAVVVCTAWNDGQNILEQVLWGLYSESPGILNYKSDKQKISGYETTETPFARRNKKDFKPFRNVNVQHRSKLSKIDKLLSGLPRM